MLSGKQLTCSWFQTVAVIWILYIFFWVFPRRQIVVGRRFGTLYEFKGWVYSVLKDHTSPYLEDENSIFLWCDGVLLSTQCNIPEDLNPYQQGGENL